MTHESTIQDVCRAEAARMGVYLWRNNSGVLPDHRGVPLRFGLANDSTRINKAIKSSDLIGWTATGRFVAVECKRPGWRYNPNDERERAQKAWIDLVCSCGGIGGFVSSVEQLRELLR